MIVPERMNDIARSGIIQNALFFKVEAPAFVRFRVELLTLVFKLNIG